MMRRKWKSYILSYSVRIGRVCLPHVREFSTCLVTSLVLVGLLAMAPSCLKFTRLEAAAPELLPVPLPRTNVKPLPTDDAIRQPVASSSSIRTRLLSDQVYVIERQQGTAWLVLGSVLADYGDACYPVWHWDEESDEGYDVLEPSGSNEEWVCSYKSRDNRCRGYCIGFDVAVDIVLRHAEAMEKRARK